MIELGGAKSDNRVEYTGRGRRWTLLGRMTNCMSMAFFRDSLFVFVMYPSGRWVLKFKTSEWIYISTYVEIECHSRSLCSFYFRCLRACACAGGSQAWTGGPATCQRLLFSFLHLGLRRELQMAVVFQCIFKKDK